MPSDADWNKDVPWLGAWIPLCVVLVGCGALLAWAGVPMLILGTVGPFMIAGVYLYLWSPRGRLVRPPGDEDGPAHGGSDSAAN